MSYETEIVFGASAIALAFGIGMTAHAIHFSQQDDLLSANLEALADAEYEEGGQYHIVGTSTTYYTDGIAQYTVMTRDCEDGGTLKCKRSTQTIWYN